MSNSEKNKQGNSKFFLLFKLLRAFVIVGIFFIFSCNNNSFIKEKNESNLSAIDTLPKKKPEKAKRDTVAIDNLAAVFFISDSTHREKLRMEMGEGPFDGADHECFYQMKNAKTSLKEHWPQIKVYEVIGPKLLVFKKETGDKTYIDLQLRNDLCGLYIFNRKKEPQIADMMGIGTSLEYYFLK